MNPKYPPKVRRVGPRKRPSRKTIIYRAIKFPVYKG